MTASPPRPALRIAVVIPCFRVRNQIMAVLAAIGDQVGAIYVVDDCCPDLTGAHVLTNCSDPRVRVLIHAENQGVGGAMLTGYRQAATDGAEVAVKIDGDGQMDPSLLPLFIAPILNGQADYTKGNRFYNIEDVISMPLARLVGNAGLSFMTKMSSGYWQIFDPTNGYTAISLKVLTRLPLHKIHRRYFFESDLLFRLGTIRARVVDVPMTAIYGDETSNLRIGRVFFQFLLGNLRNAGKRLFYNYFLRDFSIASLHLIGGLVFVAFGTVFGLTAWLTNASSGQFTSTGTVMLAALPIIVGVQLLLSFIGFDMAAAPASALHPFLIGLGPVSAPDNDTVEVHHVGR